MALVLPRETARLLYDLALREKKEPTEVMAELIRRAAEERRQAHRPPAMPAERKRLREGKK